MKKFRTLLLSLCTVVMALAGAFPAMAEVERNTLTADINGTEYTFYLDKAEKKDTLYLRYYTLNSKGERERWLSITNGVSAKGAWGIVFDDMGEVYVFADRNIDIEITSVSSDGKTSTGTLEADYQKKSESVRITDGEFDYTLGDRHSRLIELYAANSSTSASNA